MRLFSDSSTLEVVGRFYFWFEGYFIIPLSGFFPVNFPIILILEQGIYSLEFFPSSKKTIFQAHFPENCLDEDQVGFK